MSIHLIQFNASAGIEQKIDIVDDNYTIDDVMEGLKEGSLFTTLTNVEPTIIHIPSMNIVALVLKTECPSYSDYSDFELVE